ncbi:MAG: hypothetical protein AAF340_15005 [Pseudomonadota bacterium]
MSRVLIVPSLFAAALLTWLWVSGGFDALAAWAAGEQRGFQNDMALGLRALRTGEPGAVTALLSICFAYGFFHAIGPGHGKVLIGGYGLGRQVPWLRLSVISLLASLGQAVTAVALVFVGVTLFGLARDQMIGVTEDIMAPASYGAIGLIGGWLIWRGVRKSWQRDPPLAHSHAHTHHHDANATCHTCGHKHGPDLDEVEGARSLREALILIGGIAIRPCTGALFLLIITSQMGVFGAGVAGAFAMALGTATVTIGVALASVGMRGGLMSGLQGSAVLAWVIPAIEILAGLLIAVIATGLFLRAIA